MPANVHRQTIDLSAYPDLVVIYLGLLLHERIFYSFSRPT